MAMSEKRPGPGRIRALLCVLALAAFVPLLSVGTAPRAEAASVSQLQQYRAWMEEARRMYPYPQSIDKMYRVMMCESGGNPRAVGGRGAWLGLFQYAPTTWRASWNPYRNNSLWDAKSQIFATAKAWSVRMQSHWSCYYITAGR